MAFGRSNYVLRWHEPQVKSKKPVLLGVETFSGSQIADLLCRIETLLATGHLISVNPPAEPHTVEVTANPSDCTIDVIAK